MEAQVEAGVNPTEAGHKALAALEKYLKLRKKMLEVSEKLALVAVEIRDPFIQLPRKVAINEAIEYLKSLSKRVEEKSCFLIEKEEFL